MGSRKAGIFADEAFTAKELVLQNLSDLSPDSAGFGKKPHDFSRACIIMAMVLEYPHSLRCQPKSVDNSY